MSDNDKQNQNYVGFSLDNSVKFYVNYDEDLGQFVGDVFDAKLEETDIDKAYVESFEFDNLQEAIDDLKHYKLGLTLSDLK